MPSNCNEWFCHYTEHVNLVYKMDINDVPHVTVSIKVISDLSVYVYVYGKLCDLRCLIEDCNVSMSDNNV